MYLHRYDYNNKRRVSLCSEKFLGVTNNYDLVLIDIFVGYIKYYTLFDGKIKDISKDNQVGKEIFIDYWNKCII
jgi:hypothetical protein